MQNYMDPTFSEALEASSRPSSREGRLSRLAEFGQSHFASVISTGTGRTFGV